MPKSTEVCNYLLALIFNTTTWANIAQNAVAAPLTNLYIALYTDDPGLGGDPRTNEANYGNYARLAVTRDTNGWKVPTGGQTKNKSLAQFIECNGGSNTITYAAIVTTPSGDGDVLYSGQLGSPRTISNGIQPQFAAEALVVTET